MHRVFPQRLPASHRPPPRVPWRTLLLTLLLLGELVAIALMLLSVAR